MLHRDICITMYHIIISTCKSDTAFGVCDVLVFEVMLKEVQIF